MNKNPFLFFLLYILMTGTGYGQKIFISGKEGNRPLEWVDFKSEPDNESPFFANTHWSVGFKFSGLKFSADTAILQGFEATLNFDSDKSWLKKGKGSDELLKHEQGHFDIGILCQREIIQKINSAVLYKTDYKSKIQTLFSSTLEKYKQIQEKYDDETNHSIKREEQEKWDLFIKTALAK